MKLYDLPKGARIKAETSDETGKLGDFIIFDHVDGMYSLCRIEGKPDKIVHLGATTELKKLKDHYVIV
jgi:hypothetical protein